MDKMDRVGLIMWNICMLTCVIGEIKIFISEIVLKAIGSDQHSPEWLTVSMLALSILGGILVTSHQLRNKEKDSE